MNITDFQLSDGMTLQEAASKVVQQEWCKGCNAHLTLEKSIASGYCCCCRNDHSENPW